MPSSRAKSNLGSNRTRRLERRYVVRGAYPSEYGFFSPYSTQPTYSQWSADQAAMRSHDQAMAKQANISAGIQAGGQLVGDLTAMTGQLFGAKIQAEGAQKLARVQGKWGAKLATKQAKLADSQTGLANAQASLASAMRPTPWALIAGVLGISAIGLAFVLTRNK